jgi:Uma2 family endonuclease
MSAAIGSTRRVWTEEELQALPDRGYDYELVNGELVMSPKNNFEHENLCARLFLALATFNRTHRLGAVLGSNLGCWMENRNCRAPDLSFISKERLRQFGFKSSTRKFLPGAPDLAVEIVSPSNAQNEIDARLKDFFSSGTKLAWIIHPEEQFVQVCHSPTDRTLLHTQAVLDGEQLLPGFRFPIADLFKEEEWEL